MFLKQAPLFEMPGVMIEGSVVRCLIKFMLIVTSPLCITNNVDTIDYLVCAIVVHYFYLCPVVTCFGLYIW